jgi:hypothetical protein
MLLQQTLQLSKALFTLAHEDTSLLGNLAEASLAFKHELQLQRSQQGNVAC